MCAKGGGAGVDLASAAGATSYAPKCVDRMRQQLLRVSALAIATERQLLAEIQIPFGGFDCKRCLPHTLTKLDWDFRGMPLRH